jgi:transposase-like protein
LLEKGYSVRQISSFVGVGTQFVMKVRKVIWT